jgi:hypothetical protein
MIFQFREAFGFVFVAPVRGSYWYKFFPQDKTNLRKSSAISKGQP